MATLNKTTAKKLLISVRDFILQEIFPDDRKAQLEIQDIFSQLLRILD